MLVQCRTPTNQKQLIWWETDSRLWYVHLTWSVYSELTQADKHMCSGLLKYIPQKKGVTGSLIRGVKCLPEQWLAYRIL